VRERLTGPNPRDPSSSMNSKASRTCFGRRPQCSRWSTAPDTCHPCHCLAKSLGDALTLHHSGHPCSPRLAAMALRSVFRSVLSAASSPLNRSIFA